MSAVENKALARRVIEEMFNKGNLDVADELFAPDYVDHDPAMPEDVRGPEGFKEYVCAYRSAFSDLHIQIEDQIAEGDKVVTRWTGTGTHERRGPRGHRTHRQPGDAAGDGDRTHLRRQARGGLGGLRLDEHDAAAGRHVAPHRQAGSGERHSPDPSCVQIRCLHKSTPSDRLLVQSMQRLQSRELPYKRNN